SPCPGVPVSQLAYPCWRLIRLTWFSDKRQRGRGNRTAQTAGPLAGRRRLSRHGSKAERRRWDGSETALREAKAPLRGAGPGTGPMLRSGSPDLVRQELAAWAAGVGMTRGVVLDGAPPPAPARKGRPPGLAARPRDLSFARALRAVLSAIRIGNTCYHAVTSEIGKYRNI